MLRINRLVTSMVLLVPFAACGEGSDGAADGPESAATAERSAGSATLMVGNHEYTIDMTGVESQCRSTGSAIVGSFNLGADGRPQPVEDTGAALQVNFDIPPPEAGDSSPPPRVFLIDAPEQLMWLAGADPAEEIDAEHSVVSDWTLADGVARGTARFAELNSYDQDPGSVEGTFEIVCGG